MSAQAQSIAEMAPPPAKGAEEKPALRVWQYEVPALARSNTFIQKMPRHAVVLGVYRGTQSGVMYAWVNPGMPMEERLFYGVKTNFPLPQHGQELRGLDSVGNERALGVCNGLQPVGSFPWDGQTWHLFEVLRQERRSREPGEEG